MPNEEQARVAPDLQLLERWAGAIESLRDTGHFLATSIFDTQGVTRD